MKSTNLVLSATTEFRARALPKLESRPIVEGRPKADHAGTLDALEGELTWASGNLFAKDQVYIHVVADDARYFADRGETSVSLRDVMVRGRGIFDNCYRPKNVEEFGFARNVSEDPEVLLLQGQHLESRLAEPDLPVPEPLDEALAVDPSVLVKVIAPRVAALDKVLRDIRKGRRERQLASLERNEAIQFFDNTFTYVARTVEAMLNLAGEKKLAELVRTSRRAVRVVEEPVVAQEGVSEEVTAS